MTGDSVNGGGNGARSGAQALLLLATPLNAALLRALADRPKQQVDLRRDSGTPAQTTLRAHLTHLVDAGVISKERRNRFPGVLQYELTDAGRGLLFVADILDDWLELAPAGPLSIRDSAAKAAIKALVEGWSATMLRVLAARPLSLTELARLISRFSYPALERRLSAMRLAGQVEAIADGHRGKGRPYDVTAWTRLGVAPLAAASRWERRHRSETTPPIGRHDCEAFFLLAAPLLELPPDLAGQCRFGASFAGNRRGSLAGVMIEVVAGGVASCTTQLQGNPDGWALASPTGWLTALIERDESLLEIGGDGRLARSLLDALHDALFGRTPLTARDPAGEA